MLWPKRYAAPENSTGMNGPLRGSKNSSWGSPAAGSTSAASSSPTIFGRKSRTTTHW